MNEYPHGDPTRFRYGCDCDECRAGWAAYMRRWRREHPQRPEVLVSTIAPLIREAGRRGWSPKGFAARAGVTTATINRIIDGRTQAVNYKTYLGIVRALEGANR